MPKTHKLKSPFLRLFLAFYGNFFLCLAPPSPLSLSPFYNFKCCHFNLSLLRPLYHMLLILFFNWVSDHPDSIHEQFMSEAAYFGKPLARLSYRLFDTTHRFLLALNALYCLRFGPKTVQILDQLYVLSGQTEQKAKYIFGGLLLFDHAFFKVAFKEALYSVFQSYSTPKFGWSILSLITQYIVYGQSVIFFRLLIYGKWATWKSLKKSKISREKVIQLFELNKNLGRLLSLPLSIELVHYTLNTIWALSFMRRPVTLLHAVLFQFPLINVVLVYYYSGKISYILRKVSKSQLLKFENLQNQAIYWRQVDEIYGSERHGFYCSIFHLVTIDASFTMHLVLLITNYSLLVKQTN